MSWHTEEQSRLEPMKNGILQMIAHVSFTLTTPFKLFPYIPCRRFSWRLFLRTIFSSSESDVFCRFFVIFLYYRYSIFLTDLCCSKWHYLIKYSTKMRNKVFSYNVIYHWFICETWNELVERVELILKFFLLYSKFVLIT